TLRTAEGGLEQKTRRTGRRVNIKAVDRLKGVVLLGATPIRLGVPHRRFVGDADLQIVVDGQHQAALIGSATPNGYKDRLVDLNCLVLKPIPLPIGVREML